MTTDEHAEVSRKSAILPPPEGFEAALSQAIKSSGAAIDAAIDDREHGLVPRMGCRRMQDAESGLAHLTACALVNGRNDIAHSAASAWENALNERCDRFDRSN